MYLNMQLIAVIVRLAIAQGCGNYAGNIKLPHMFCKQVLLSHFKTCAARSAKTTIVTFCRIY